MADIVAAYDLAERDGMARLPNRAIEAFQAAHFSSIGYPSRIKHQKELWRYIDVMHEGRFEKNLKLLGKVSQDELNLAKLLANETLSYSRSEFQRSLTGRHSITRSLLQRRGLDLVGVDGSKPRNIVELGPGSGYLSLMMAICGHKVSTVEVAQAFALHQGEIFAHFLSRRFTRNPKINSDPNHFGALTESIKQIPWWLFANLDEEPSKYDLVTVNHALSEFHWDALHYTMEYFGRLHKEIHGTSPTIVAESLGAGFLPHDKVLRHFNLFGWCYEASSHYFIFQYNPEGAVHQLEVSNQQEKSESRRKKWHTSILGRVYGRVNKGNTTKPSAEGPIEDLSIKALRQIFESLQPQERTPDEAFNEHIRVNPELV